tara:strand:- start:550 stop:726 length:177 start_codon:yes stop_codon:yes gene_type:complete
MILFFTLLYLTFAPTSVGPLVLPLKGATSTQNWLRKQKALIFIPTNIIQAHARLRMNG